MIGGLDNARIALATTIGTNYTGKETVSEQQGMVSLI